MSGQIFISYRRDDASSAAGRLYDRLLKHFQQNQIFMDIDNLEPGVDFVEAIEASVSSCDVLVAVVGRHWLNVSDEEGKRRLDNPQDWVVLEIGTALKRGIRVIPVLVEGAVMPREGQLPEELKTLVRRQALAISNDRFGTDSERLVRVVGQVLERVRLEQQRKREEQERVEVERREREERERLEAERGQKEAEDRSESERKEIERQRAAEWLAEAKRCLDEEDYTKALSLLGKAAEAGNVEATYHLGFLYHSGRGVKQDYDRACAWYQKAAHNGNADAMYQLGRLFQDGPRQDIYQAFEWYRRAADKGDPNAKRALEELRLNRPGVL